MPFFKSQKSKKSANKQVSPDPDAVNSQAEVSPAPDAFQATDVDVNVDSAQPVSPTTLDASAFAAAPSPVSASSKAQKPELLINATIRTDDSAGAQDVQLALGSAEDLQAMLVEAIMATAGIEEVTNGPVEVAADVGQPMLLQRGRLTMIEDQLSVISKGGFQPDKQGDRLQRAEAVEGELELLAGSDRPDATLRLPAGERYDRYDRGDEGCDRGFSERREYSEPPPERGRNMQLSADAQDRGAFSAERSPRSPSMPEDTEWTSRTVDTGTSLLRLFDGKEAAAPKKTQKRSRYHLNKFKDEMLRREQSLAGAWRSSLDPQWTGQLAIHDFCRACRNIGYRGNMKEIWNDLDVDGNGLISLMELDWDEAHDLGKFRAKVLQQYPSCADLAKAWGMTGPRRYHVDDFTGLLLSWGFADTPAQADKLFRMLCGVPVGGESAGFLGRLGPLKDSAPAVTSREFLWLDTIGEDLPVVAFDRVQPGDLGMVANPDGDMPTEEERCRMRQKIEEHKAILKDQETVVFNRLYDEAMDHVQRFRTLGDEPQEEKRELSDPMLYDRLYNDHIVHRQRRERIVEDAEKARQQAFNQGFGVRVHNPETFNRIIQPKKKFNDFNFDCQAKKEHLYHLLNIEQLMDECTKLANQIREERNPNFEWRSLGKTRNEMIWMLETEKIEEEKEEKPVPQSCKKLYNDAARRHDRLKGKQEEEKAKREQEVMNTFRCDLHKEYRSNCNLCKRWQAIQSGEWDKRTSDATGRLWKHAEHTVSSHIQTRENHFRALIEDGDKLGLVHNRTLVSAKVALEDEFKNDHRWNLVSGRDRDRLVAEGIRQFTQLRKEAEEKGIDWNPKKEGNQETFYRLYLDGNQKDAHRQEQKREEAEAELAELADNSIHRDVVRDPRVFERLYRNEKREGFDDDPEHQYDRLQERLHADRRRRERSDKLNQARSPGRTPRTPANLEDFSSAQEKVPLAMFMMYFPSLKWKPPLAFESQLKLSMQEFGARELSTMSVRIRQATTEGVVVQLTGPIDRVQELECLSMISQNQPEYSLHCMKHRLNAVWMEECGEDPLGEFVDFLNMRYNQMRDVFDVMDVNNSGTCTRPEFFAGLKKLGFFGDSKFIWHALEGGTGTLSSQTFARLKDAVIKVIPKPVSSSSRGQSKALVQFIAQVAERFPEPVSAFEQLNLSRSGKLTAVELASACKASKLKCDAKAIFREMDQRLTGSVLLSEWLKVYADCRSDDSGRKSTPRELNRANSARTDRTMSRGASGKIVDRSNSRERQALDKQSTREGMLEQKSRSDGFAASARGGKPGSDKRAQSNPTLKPQASQDSPIQRLGSPRRKPKVKSKQGFSDSEKAPSQAPSNYAPSNYEPDSEPGARTPGSRTPRNRTPRGKAEPAGSGKGGGKRAQDTSPERKGKDSRKSPARKQRSDLLFEELDSDDSGYVRKSEFKAGLSKGIVKLGQAPAVKEAAAGAKGGKVAAGALKSPVPGSAKQIRPGSAPATKNRGR